MADSNLFLRPKEILPIAQENNYLGIFHDILTKEIKLQVLNLGKFLKSTGNCMLCISIRTA